VAGLKAFILLAFLAALSPAQAMAARWTIDGDTSEITFKVGYLDGGEINIAFRRYSAAIDFDPNRPEGTKAVITLFSDSVDTRLPPVDALIRSAGYLNAEAFPTITFDLSDLTQTSKSTAILHGVVTLLGVTRPIALDARVYEFDPFAADPANRVAAFEITGELDRADFGNKTGAPQIGTLLPIRILLEMHPAP
jgi:polyisoprenoid-binding protein YceI